MREHAQPSLLTTYVTDSPSHENSSIRTLRLKEPGRFLLLYSEFSYVTLLYFRSGSYSSFGS